MKMLFYMYAGPRIGKILYKFWVRAGDWSRCFITIAWTILNLNRKPTVLIPFKNNWLLVKKRSKLFLPKSRPKFLMEPYERYFNVNINDTVIDVGACIGEFSIAAALKAKKVIAIEPNRRNIVWLRNNVALNRLHNIILIKKAIWNSSTSLKLYQHNSIGKHSLVQKGTEGTENVRTDTLDNIISKFNVHKVDFLKIDVEGAESEALKGAKRVLSMTKKIVLETHIRNDQKTTYEIKRTLEKHGFKTKIEVQSFENDIIYGRRNPR